MIATLWFFRDPTQQLRRREREETHPKGGIFLRRIALACRKNTIYHYHKLDKTLATFRTDVTPSALPIQQKDSKADDSRVGWGWEDRGVAHTQTLNNQVRNSGWERWGANNGHDVLRKITGNPSIIFLPPLAKVSGYNKGIEQQCSVPSLQIRWGKKYPSRSQLLVKI
ncbi:hypothetical protein PoB_006186200 [Plakobranchus ocellatus]|uniref:Uncharacterized protein n=1 Tax=Plakobranchus ocellatus TaxID=259542 RepID=A0AAV4CTX5_9GAST|nr:hypothetical protein PoB_006186200 [Plakobranchus ocellatus]